MSSNRRSSRLKKNSVDNIDERPIRDRKEGKKKKIANEIETDKSSDVVLEAGPSRAFKDSRKGRKTRSSIDKSDKVDSVKAEVVKRVKEPATNNVKASSENNSKKSTRKSIKAEAVKKIKKQSEDNGSEENFPPSNSEEYFSSSGSEDEWEDVDDGEDSLPSTSNQGIELVVEDKKSEESKWAKFLRQEINRKIKERQVNLHKVHLLCYMAHLRKWASMLTESRILSCLCLSLIPESYTCLSEVKFDESVAERFLNWFKSAFVSSQISYMSTGGLLGEVKRLEKLIGKKVFETDRDLASILFLCLHSLRLSVRLCLSCHPISLNVTISSLSASIADGQLESSSSTKFGKTVDISAKQSISKNKENRKSFKLGKRNAVDTKNDDGMPTKKMKIKAYRDYWVEYWDEHNMRWICLDPLNGAIDTPETIEKDTSSPIHYVISVDDGGGIRDVTARYASSFLSSKFRRHRVDAGNWWKQTMKIFRSKDRIRHRMETIALTDHLCSKPLPTTIAEFKSHPLYVLKKDLLKFEAIYPEGQKPIGQIRGFDVYPRSSVHHLQGALNWLKEARSIKPNEKPYKVVKARPNIKVPEELREPRTLDVFGYWQTEPYKPPEVIDGRIPRNEFGNVYLYKECMLPKGCVHLRLEGLVSISRRLDIDCVPAVVGWEFHKGGNHPILDGCVVLSEHEKLLRNAWREEYQKKLQMAVKKKKDRVLTNWRRFIKGVLTLKKVRDKFLGSASRVVVESDEKLHSNDQAVDSCTDADTLDVAWPRMNFDMPQNELDKD